MKNIITILLVLIIPIAIYLILEKDSNTDSAIATENDLPTLMTFTSTMCLDCQKMKAIISEIQGDYTGKLNFININALDKKRSIQAAVNKHKVVLVPTLVFIDKNENEINKIEGAISKEELIKNIEGLLNE